MQRTPLCSTLHSVRRLNARSEFREALYAGEIEAFYEAYHAHGRPARARAEGRCAGSTGSSAYCRLGLHPIVEQTQLIGSLTCPVLERAVFDCARWRRGGQELRLGLPLVSWTCSIPTCRP